MVSPMNSRRTGCVSPAGKMSTMPPRTANSPCSSAGSSRANPASTSSSARSVGAMSCPGLNSSEAASIRSGVVTRGSSEAADAISTRAEPWAIEYRARARAEVTPMCGAMPRYGSISCEGNGNTTRSVAACVSPSSAARKNDTSAQVCSRSPSLGTTYSTTPCGFACAAAATKSAFAESVSPETRRAGTSIPLRVTAVLRRARRFSEVEVATVSRRAFSKARQTSSVSGRRQSFQPTLAERRTRDQKATAGLTSWL